MPARKRQPTKRKAEAPAKEVDDKKKEKRGKVTEPANLVSSMYSGISTLFSPLYLIPHRQLSSEYPDALLEHFFKIALYKDLPTPSEAS